MMESSEMENFTVISACILAAIFLLYVFGSGLMRALFVKVLSFTINSYLSWRHPVYHIDGRMTIPSCDYHWPNGQGDEAKFLQGLRKSDEWGEKLGPIYRIWSGMIPEIVLTKPEDVRIVFADSNRHSKATSNDSGYLMSQVLGSCVGLVSGTAWEMVRKAFQEPFARDNTLRSINSIRDQVEEYLDTVKRTGNLERELIDPAQDLKMLPFLIIARFLYGPLGKKAIQELEDLSKTREKLFMCVIRGGISRFSWSKHLPSMANSLLAEFQTRWRTFNDEAIVNCLESEHQPPVTRIHASLESDKITEEHFYQTIDEILFANLDVTTGGLSWNMVFLAAHSGYQTKLREEFHQAENGEGLDAYLSRNTTLLSACILESSRLRPAAAFSVPQSCPTRRIIGDFVIPAGTNIIVDSNALNIRNGFWGKDSSSYRPERFLELAPADTRYLHWRFGFGPRQCLGKYMADLIIKTTLAHIVSQYNLALIEQKDRVISNPEVWISHPQTVLRCVKR